MRVPWSTKGEICKRFLCLQGRGFLLSEHAVEISEQHYCM